MALYHENENAPFRARYILFKRAIVGVILMAVFIGIAQKMRVSEAEGRYDRCLLEVERTEWQCRETGEYPRATLGPVDVIDPCETYALFEKDQCAQLYIAR